MAENEEIKALEEKTEATEQVVETKPAEAVEAKPAEAKPAKKSKGDLSEMSERELLIELLREQKKASRRSAITAASMVAICLIIGAAVLIIVPRVNATLNNAYQAIDTIETVVANA